MAIEQLIPGTVEWDAFYANHIFRYQFALDYLIKNEKHSVLDAATGVGYGAYFLASHGISNVVAIDRSEDALNIATTDFKHKAIKFLKDDCHHLGAAREFAPYDAIVSFETLEHLPQPDDFLQQSFSVLKSGGVIIVSTPNVEAAPYASKENWPFHEKDYDPAVLTTILDKHNFRNIKLFGQALSQTGILKQEFRHELNRINSNPLMRLGNFLQRKLRNKKPGAVLPESINDFELVDQPDIQGKSCFVIIAVAEKKAA